MWKWHFAKLRTVKRNSELLIVYEKAFEQFSSPPMKIIRKPHIILFFWKTMFIKHHPVLERTGTLILS